MLKANMLELAENESKSEILSKLGICEQCDKGEAKYTCPQCEMKTCCLNCVNQHKKERSCFGVRVKTAYIPKTEFTDLDLLSDYRLLEEASCSIDKCRRDDTKRHTRMNTKLPPHLQQLRKAAANKGTILHFLPRNFSRNKVNSTILDNKTKEILWTIQWKFNWDGSEKTDSRIPEGTLLRNALEPHITSTPTLNIDLEKLHVFLPVEYVEGQSNRFYPMDLSKTIEENLKETTIVEHPIFHVVDDPKNLFPLYGSNKVVKQQNEPPEKKSKMSFFELSDGEINDSD